MPDLPADQRALLAAVITAPDDDTPRLVYADWLEDAGDGVQAGYIRDSIRLARMAENDPERRPLIGRLSETLLEHSGGWAKALGLSADITRHYRRGFVHTVEFRSLPDLLEHGPAWFTAAPVEGLALDVNDGFEVDRHGTDWWQENSDFWGQFIDTPELARLRVLTVRGLGLSEWGWDELLSRPFAAGLRELHVPGCRWTDQELECVNRPHLAGLEVLDLGDVPPDRFPDGAAMLVCPWHFKGLRAVYFGGADTGEWGGASPALAAALTERFGDRWGDRRPLPPVWC